MNTVMRDFEVLCAQINLRAKETYGYNQIEDLLLKMLNFIKAHDDYRDSFVVYFSEKISGEGENDLVYGNYNHLIQIIQFCMREMQWPEIKEAAIRRKSASSDWRVIGTMDQILEVYETEWPDDELYEYYSKEVKD
ncbi:MAG: hypothetical protein Tsb005_12250 [Gammaproteobacteria bacterium]